MSAELSRGIFCLDLYINLDILPFDRISNVIVLLKPIG